MKKLLFAVVVLLTMSLCRSAQAQISSARNWELGGGWVHITQDFGLDGLNVGGGYKFSRRVWLAGDFDAGFDTSTLGTFGAASQGSVKSRLQNYLIGPRLFFPGALRNDKLVPFGEFEIGITHLSSTVRPTTGPETHSADSAFSWMFGGGLDYAVDRSWSIRGKLDFLRTHLASQGQSRARFVIGAWYHFGH